MNFFSRIRHRRQGARPAPTQLRVEQLEDRSVPSGTPLGSLGGVHFGGGCFGQAGHSFVCPPGFDHQGNNCQGQAHNGIPEGPSSNGYEHQHAHHHQNIGSISGTVLDDTSGTPITGVTISLLNSQGQVVATTTTNASGVYTFSGLAAGSGTTYTVVQTTLPNYNLMTSPQTVTLTQASPQVQNVNFDNVESSGGIIA